MKKYTFLITITEMDTPFWNYINNESLNPVIEVQDELMSSIAKGTMELDDNMIQFLYTQ